MDISVFSGLSKRLLSAGSQKLDDIFMISLGLPFTVILRFLSGHIFQTFSSSCTSTVSLTFPLHLSDPLLIFPHFLYKYCHLGQNRLKTIKNVADSQGWSCTKSVHHQLGTEGIQYFT